MRKLGLKLYSTNASYVREAEDLIATGAVDFIELLPVPGSYEATIDSWRRLKGEFIIHAPHYSFGVNLGLREAYSGNLAASRETMHFADKLSSPYVIWHPGVESDIRETVRQLRLFNDKRNIVENKPFSTVDGKSRCIGCSVAEIMSVMRDAGCGFCMDVGHAASYAIYAGKNPYSVLRDFAKLRPAMFHISDGKIMSGLDTHDHIGAGDYDWEFILPLIPDGARVTLETKKDFSDSLSDFRRDAAAFREIERRLVPKGRAGLAEAE